MSCARANPEDRMRVATAPAHHHDVFIGARAVDEAGIADALGIEGPDGGPITPGLSKEPSRIPPVHRQVFRCA